MINQLETEKSLLGSILQEPDRVLALCLKKGLTPDTFQTVALRNAYRGSLYMLEKDLPIDTITLANTIKAEPKFLNDYLENAVWTHAESYIDDLLAAQVKRKLLELPMKITEAIREERSPQEVIASSINDLQTIQKSNEIKLFPAIRYEDLLAYETPAGHIIAGQGWLRRGAGCLLTGGTSLGKSILATQIAINVSSGQNILGCMEVKAPMRVTYLQAENDEETLKRDVLSIVKHTESDASLVQQNLAIHHIYGLSGPSLDNFIAQEVTKQHTDLLILDPYQSCIPSNMNINDAGTFLAFIFNINRIIKKHNCAFMLVTHTPKPHDREHWTARESVYMAVGSQAIAAWARTSAEITGFKDDDSMYRLRFGKNAERTGIVNDNGGLVRDLMIQHSPSIHEPFWKVAETQEEPTKVSEKAQKIIDYAAKNPTATYSEIAAHLHCSKAWVAKWYPKPDEPPKPDLF